MANLWNGLDPTTQQLVILILGAVLKHFYDRLGGKSPAPVNPVPPAPAVPGVPAPGSSSAESLLLSNGHPIAAAILALAAKVLQSGLPTIGAPAKDPAPPKV